MLTGRYDDARSFASRLHRKQTRKGTPIPYISQLIAVSSLASREIDRTDGARVLDMGATDLPVPSTA